MVLIREKTFPKIKLAEKVCPWHETARIAHRVAFENQINEWLLRAEQYKCETTRQPRFVETAFIEVIQLKTQCAYKIGQIIQVPVSELKSEQRIVEAYYSDCWVNGIVKDVKKVHDGDYMSCPNWELESKPYYEPFAFSVHDAVSEMQNMIRESCPNAHWEGFWNDYPERMGYDDTVEEETEETKDGNTIYLETGVGYEVKTEGDRLVLYKNKIERFNYYPPVTEYTGYVGLGSWSDKGYF